MSKTWKEWYVKGPDGVDYKICRGTLNGEPEVSLYKQQEDGKFELVIQIIGLSNFDADGVVHQLVKEYDTEKIFSSRTYMGKAKTDEYN